MIEKSILEKNWHIIALAACLTSIMLGIVFGYFISGRNLVIALETMPELEYEVILEATDTHAMPDVIDDITIPVYAGTPPTHRYVVTVVDGFVAVFYASHTGGALKEVTTAAAHALSAYELEQLEAGIFIYTEEALARILQDYGS